MSYDFDTMDDAEVATLASRVLNRLAKWRAHYAGWQLGTRAKSDPESQAVRDHREATLLLRVEVTALTGLLIDKGIFTSREFTERAIVETEHHMRLLEQRWPGVSSDDDGLSYDLAKAQAWMKDWLP